MKMRNKNKTSFMAIVIVLSILIVSTSLCLLSRTTSAFADTKIGKVLFVVTSEDEYNSIFEWQNDADINRNLYDICLPDDADTVNLSSYLAVALPCGEIDDSIIQNAFNDNTYVYLYGSLTINEYKQSVGLADYSLNINLRNSGDGVVTQINQSFDVEYEENELFNIISYSRKPLLCKIADDSISSYTYLFNVVQNFEGLTQPVLFSTILRSAFDFTSSWNPSGNLVCTAHMDYTLYQNFDEQDPVYDYFGISTKVFVTKSSGLGRISGVNTKYKLPNASDNLLETGPESRSSLGKLSFSLGYGKNGPTGSISYSVDLSDTTPTINRIEDYANDLVEWKMIENMFHPLGNTPLDCVATWASSSNLATIDVYFQGIVNIGPYEQYPTYSDYTKVPIRFGYCTVSFDKQDGTGGSSTVTAECGAPMPSATAPTRVGYTFGGYFTGINGTGVKYYTESMASARNYDILGDTMLYAKWWGNTYTVTLDTQGGIVFLPSVMATYGSEMLYAFAPLKSGYTFEGYYSAPNGQGVKYYSADMSSARNYDIVGDTVLYAYWTKDNEHYIDGPTYIDYANGLDTFTCEIPEGCTTYFIIHCSYAFINVYTSDGTIHYYDYFGESAAYYVVLYPGEYIFEIISDYSGTLLIEPTT